MFFVFRPLEQEGVEREREGCLPPLVCVAIKVLFCNEMGFIINHEIVIVTVITEGGKYGEKPPELMMEGTILLSMKH